MTGLKLALTGALWEADTRRSTNTERVLEQKVLLLRCLCVVDSSIVWEQMCPWSAGWDTGAQRNLSYCAAENQEVGEVFPKWCRCLRCTDCLNPLLPWKAQPGSAKFFALDVSVLFVCLVVFLARGQAEIHDHGVLPLSFLSSGFPSSLPEQLKEAWNSSSVQTTFWDSTPVQTT